MAKLLLDPFFQAVIVPLAVLIMGAVATKVIRNENWTLHHWVLGVQMSMAAFSIAMLKVLESIGNSLLRGWRHLESWSIS